MRIWRVHVEMRRNLFVSKGQDQLDQAGDPGRRLEVADIRLHRSNHERRGRIAIGLEHGGERLDLKWIAEAAYWSRAPRCIRRPAASRQPAPARRESPFLRRSIRVVRALLGPS